MLPNWSIVGNNSTKINMAAMDAIILPVRVARLVLPWIERVSAERDMDLSLGEESTGHGFGTRMPALGLNDADAKAVTMYVATLRAAKAEPAVLEAGRKTLDQRSRQKSGKYRNADPYMLPEHGQMHEPASSAFVVD